MKQLSSVPSTRIEEKRAMRHLRIVSERSARSSLVASSVVNAIFFALFGIYTFFFCKSLPHWFHPGWTTDDALQQSYPFHEVNFPGLYSGDLITEVMEGYLAPLHYWTSWAVTWVVGDPIVMGHWLMLAQVLFALAFIFLTVRQLAGTAAALVACTWLLHTRQIIQRMTGGLPRGWAAGVIAMSLYFMVRKQHWGVLFSLLIGCLLHPPATLIAAMSYGLYLSFGFLRPATRAEFKRPFLRLCLLSPLYILLTWSIVHKPEHIGQMVTFEQASEMPEFQYPHGRFPFTPLRPAGWELRTYGFQAFIGRFYKAAPFFREFTRPIVIGLLLSFMLIGLLWYREVFPPQFAAFLLAILSIYAASRLFAFRLYVPNRHLQFPLAMFFIMVFPVALWKVAEIGTRKISWLQRIASPYAGAVMLSLLIFFVAACSGSGLYGNANFNYSRTKKGEVFNWLGANSSPQALVAGHPTFIDGLMLFSARRGYITTETAHPFYPEYNREVQRRLKISLAAHYSRDLRELYSILSPEGIDYFVFERKQFYPDALAEADYHPPLDTFVKEATSRNWADYAYRKLPEEVDMSTAPFMPFKDSYAAVVDVNTLGEWLVEKLGEQEMSK